MRGLSLFLRRCHIFHKRFFRKKGFLVLLLLIPLIGAALGMSAKMDSGMMTVALAREDDDAVARSLIDSLLSDRGVVRFLDAETKEDAISLVEHGKADAAWIFVARFTETVERFAEKQNARNALVHIVGRDDGILQTLLREKLCGALYPYLSERYYLHLVTETLSAEGIDVPDEATLMAYYDAEAPEGAELFDFHFTDGASDGGAAVLMAPLRGLLSVTVVLGALAVSMFYKMDAERGVFTGFSGRSMPFFTFGYHFVAVFDISVAMLLSLWVAGAVASPLTELLYLFLFSLAASLFAMVLQRLIRPLSLLAAMAPLLVLAMTVICPVFFTVPDLGILPYLFPPYYYIMGMAGAMSAWAMVGYIAVLVALLGIKSACHRHTDLSI